MTEKQKGLLKTVAPYITIIIALGGFWFTMTGAFQTKVEAAAEKQQTIQTFQMMQNQIDTSTKQMRKNNEIADLNRQMNYLTEYRYKLKSFLRENNDPETRRELEEVERNLEKTKEKLNNLLLGE